MKRNFRDRWYFWPIFIIVSILLGPFAGPVGAIIWLFVITFLFMTKFYVTIL